MSNCLVYDGSFLIHRILFKKEFDFMYSSEGVFTGGLHGSINSMFYNIQSFKPDKIYFILDGKKSERRMKLTEGTYKEGRSKEPKTEEERLEKEEHKRKFALTADLLLEVLPYLGIHALRLDEKEADDVVYKIAKEVSEDFDKVIVVTADKDMYTFIDDKIDVYRPIRNEYVSKENIEEVTSVPYGTYILSKAIEGDPSDSIKGVKGTGKKTANSVINETTIDLDDLDSFFSYCSSHKSKRVQKINDQKDIVLRNLEVMDCSLEEFSDEELSVINKEIRNNLKVDDMVIYEKLREYDLSSLSDGLAYTMEYISKLN